MKPKRKKSTHKKLNSKVKPQYKTNSGKTISKDKELTFMIQLGDPAILRKDILESLRETIIFMQGYENFKKIQEEKFTALKQLKEITKEINRLLNDQLSKYLPKGKLKGLALPEKEIFQEMEESPKVEIFSAKPTKTKVNPEDNNGFDNLDSQLKDIEKQLQGM